MSAVWAGGVDGGAWFDCAVDNIHNVNRCTFFDDYSGNIWNQGYYQLMVEQRAARIEELQYAFFSGTFVELKNGTRLVPVIPPPRLDNIPEEAAWKGDTDGFNPGWWFVCSINDTKNINYCTVYDDYTGEIKIQGAFALSQTLRAAREDELSITAFNTHGQGLIYLEGDKVLKPVIELENNSNKLK